MFVVVVFILVITRIFCFISVVMMSIDVVITFTIIVIGCLPCFLVA